MAVWFYGVALCFGMHSLPSTPPPPQMVNKEKFSVLHSTYNMSVCKFAIFVRHILFSILSNRKRVSEALIFKNKWQVGNRLRFWHRLFYCAWDRGTLRKKHWFTGTFSQMYSFRSGLRFFAYRVLSTQFSTVCTQLNSFPHEVLAFYTCRQTSKYCTHTMQE